jgi:RNA polymerase primary sigma factor
MKRLQQVLHNSRDSLSRYVSEIAMIPLLTPEQEIDLARRIRQGDEEARNELVKSNLRLPVILAQRYSGFGVPVADLVAEGNLGLMRAAELFDSKFEAKFGTYATFWVKQKIQRAIINQSQSVRLPVWKVHRLRRMQRMTNLLAQQIGHEPSIEELASALELEREHVEEVRREKVDVQSIDTNSRDEAENAPTLAQTLSDENADNPSHVLAQKDMVEALLVSLHDLEDRELRILSMRFGLTGEEEQSLNEIGARFHVSREWIRRLQEVALVKLRRALTDYRSPKRQDEKRRMLKRVISRIQKLTGQRLVLQAGLPSLAFNGVLAFL